MDAGWLHYRSTTARGEVWLAAEMGLPAAVMAMAANGSAAAAAAGPGVATYAFATLSELHEALDRAYRLGVSLPDAPLKEFEAATVAAPRSTEAERLVVQRVGQDIFRKALIEYWGGGCPLTGIREAALLRASHIVPRPECETDALRLDVHNGLLLSALWDAAFDAGLVSFDDEVRVMAGKGLSKEAAARLEMGFVGRLRVTEAHKGNLARHRRKFGFA